MGPGGRRQSRARTRRHGYGRREDDRHDRRVPWLAGDVLDAAARESSGELDWNWIDCRVVPGGLEEGCGEKSHAARAGDRDTIAMGDCAAVSVATGDFSW